MRRCWRRWWWLQHFRLLHRGGLRALARLRLWSPKDRLRACQVGGRQEQTNNVLITQSGLLTSALPPSRLERSLKGRMQATPQALTRYLRGERSEWCNRLPTKEVVGFVLEKGKGGENMRRILLVMATAALMAAMMVAAAATAFADAGGVQPLTFGDCISAATGNFNEPPIGPQELAEQFAPLQSKGKGADDQLRIACQGNPPPF